MNGYSFNYREELTVSISQAVGCYSDFPSKRSYQIAIYQTSGLVILNNSHINYTLYLFLIAEKVLLNSNSLSYCPLKDTFDEYTIVIAGLMMEGNGISN